MKKVTVVSFGLLVAISASILATPMVEAASFLQRIADAHERHQCAIFSVNCDEDKSSSSSNPTSNTTYNYTYTYGGNGVAVSNPNTGNRAPVWNTISDRTTYAGQNMVIYVSATDADSDYLYYDARNLPNGAYFDRIMHSLSWNPSDDQSGNYSVQFSVTDNYNAPVYQTMNIVVVANQNNRAPIWTSIGDKFVSAGQLLQFNVSANDPDGDFVTYSVLNIPSGASFNSASRLFSWVPNQSQNGTYFVSFRASDGKTTSDTGVRIQVGNGNVTPTFNDAPTFFGFNPPTSATINQLYTYDVNASDPNGDLLTYSLISAPASMSINSGTGFLAWVPTSTGTNVIRVAVSDGRNQTTADFTVTVFGVGSTLPTPVTPVAPTEARLVISDITIENTNDEIIVGWKTNLPAGSRVIFDTTSQADKTRNFTYANATVDNRELVTTHSVNLGALDTNTVYYLRVVSKTNLQTAIGQEIGFIKLGNGLVQNLFGASLIDIFGSLFSNTAFLWILVLGLGTAAGLMYRKQRKAALVL